MTLQPIPMVIPDVLSFIAAKDQEEDEEAARAAAGSPNGHAPAEAKRSPRRRRQSEPEVIEGGVAGT